MGNKTNHLRGPDHPMWKGDDAGYSAQHFWIRRHRKKPEACEHCGATGVRLDWANKSHEYRRELDDWLALCKKCHCAYDKTGLCRNKLHKMTPENTYRKSNGTGGCRACRCARSEERMARQPTCSTESCEKQAKAKGLCDTCLHREYRRKRNAA